MQLASFLPSADRTILAWLDLQLGRRRPRCVHARWRVAYQQAVIIGPVPERRVLPRRDTRKNRTSTRMPKRSQGEKFDVPSELLKSSSRERKSIQRFEADPTSQPRSKQKIISARERKQQDAELRLEQGLPMERCRAVLDLMKLRADAAWFLFPVDTAAIPDYADIIDTPMDYSTVSEKLDSAAYEDNFAFAEDMRQIFRNAVKCVRVRACQASSIQEARAVLRLLVTYLVVDLVRAPCHLLSALHDVQVQLETRT